jgi:hypothetical protein
VCDGLAIADAVTRWIAENAAERAGARTVHEVLTEGATFPGRPWGLPDAALPVAGAAAQLDGVVRAIDHVVDALDAVGDLVVAEAVHQIALGNHARAAAVLSALAEGKAPPRPEVVDSPRTGTPVTHRVLLQLPDAAGAPAGWEAIPLTARALAEPALNAWAAALLGPPGDLRVRLVRASDGHGAGDVSVAELGLHAIDLLAILGPGLDAGLGELAVRALDARRPANFDDELMPAPLQLDLGRAPQWARTIRGVAEVAPLLEALGALTGRARAANARDYLLAEAAPAGGGDGVDLAELGARVSAARAELEAVGVELAQLLAGDPAADASAFADPRAFLEQHADAGPPTWGARDAWRSVLIRAAALGVRAALPPSLFESRDQVRLALREAAETAFVDIAQRRADADAQAGDTVASLTAAARAVFGEGFEIVGRSLLRNRGELDAALGDATASAAEVEGWLHGAAAVREPAGGLADLIVLADAHGAAAPPAGAVAQLPHAAGEPWLGGTLPPEGAPGGRLSLALFGPLPAAGADGAGLLVDEWTEIVPAREETTGVAIHYDQPQATPPQCVLVAVPPRMRGRWRAGDLVQTLHDTFELARIRTVELERVQDTMWGQLLPAISGELVPDAAAGGLASGDRPVLDFGANR